MKKSIKLLLAIIGLYIGCIFFEFVNNNIVFMPVDTNTMLLMALRDTIFAILLTILVISGVYFYKNR